MNQRKLQDYIGDILEGLSYCHSHGVIHSDMKIQNVLLHRFPKEDGEAPIVKVCDFGLSHIMEPKYNGKALMVERAGTKGYLAPEIKDVRILKTNLNREIPSLGQKQIHSQQG